jgi:hypothetical protein
MCRCECVELVLSGLGATRAVRALQVFEADGGLLAPSGDELADSAGRGTRRVVALVVIASCARFPPVRSVGLGPDYRRGPVRAGELPAARRTRHEALACPELCEQVAGLFEIAERRGSATRVPALAVAQEKGPCTCWPGQARNASNAPRPRA